MDINYVGLIAGAVSSMIVGSLWYSPLMFAKPWMKLVGMSDSNMKDANMTVFMGKMLAISLVEAFVVSNFLKMLGIIDVSGALQVIFWAWLGFTAATMGANYIAGKKPLQLYLIDAGYHLVNLAVMAVVILQLM